MKFLKYLSLFLLLITSTIVLSAGESSTPDPAWGLGVIAPLKIMSLDYKTNLPDKPISLYDKPSGTKTATLSISKESGLSYQDLQTSVTAAVNQADLIEVDFQGYCLKYYRITNGFANILINTAKDGYWVSVKDLTDLKYQAADWKYFLLNNFRGYHPMGDKGVNLYDKPAANSKLVALLKGNLFVITLTGKTKDQWAEAVVELYNRQPCEGGSVSKEYKGWIKIINEKRYPAIWINAEGC